MVYAAALSESKRVTRWRLILKELGHNIQHISGVDSIVADMLSRFPSSSVNKYDTRTKKAQCCAKKLFAISRAEKNEDYFQLNLLNVKRGNFFEKS